MPWYTLLPVEGGSRAGGFNFGHGSMAMITRGKEGTRRTRDERSRLPTKAKPTHAL